MFCETFKKIWISIQKLNFLYSHPNFIDDCIAFYWKILCDSTDWLAEIGLIIESFFCLAFQTYRYNTFEYERDVKSKINTNSNENSDFCAKNNNNGHQCATCTVKILEKVRILFIKVIIFCFQFDFRWDDTQKYFMHFILMLFNPFILVPM